MNITLPDTIGLRHCILRVLSAIRFQINQQQPVHLLLNPGMYERIIIIQVTTRITDSPLLIPTTSSSNGVNFISTKLNSSVHLFHDQTWNSTMFTNHNQLIMSQKKLRKNRNIQFRFSVVWKKYSSIFNGLRPVKRENQMIKHWKPPPVKYHFVR